MGKKTKKCIANARRSNPLRYNRQCFDLSIWLLNEFKEEGIKAYPIGHHLHSKHAHAAIIAEDERGHRFLCDLGDQWLKPILIDVKDQEYTNEKLGGFFPAADIRVSQVENNLQI